RGGDGIGAILLEGLDPAGGLIGVDFVESLDHGAGNQHGITLGAGHEGGAGLRILREGKIDEIVGGNVEAVLVNVTDYADDLRPVCAAADILEQDALTDGIFVVPVTL